MTEAEENRLMQQIRDASYSKGDGGPAFPNPGLADPNCYFQSDVSGMTLRDWFASHSVELDRDASKATIATLTGESLSEIAKGSLDHWRLWAKADAVWRYIQADAMLAAREAAQ